MATQITWPAGHVVTPETVFVIGDVTDGIESVTVLVHVVAAVRDAFVAVAVPVDVSRVTDFVGLAVGVSVASAKVLGASMATNRVGSRTVVVCGTACGTMRTKYFQNDSPSVQFDVGRSQ